MHFGKTICNLAESEMTLLLRYCFLFVNYHVLTDLEEKFLFVRRERYCEINVWQGEHMKNYLPKWSVWRQFWLHRLFFYPLLP